MNRTILNNINHVINMDLINDNSIILDAGAAVGSFVHELRKQDNGKTCRVICIECSKTNYNKLETCYFDNVDTIYAALIGRDIDTIKFTEFKGEIKSDGNHRYHQWGNVVGIYKDKLPKDVVVEEYDVPAYTIDRFMKMLCLDRIDYLKMDIEGSEYEVLFSVDKDLADKIGQMSIEVHDESQNDKLIKHLESLGFKVDKYDHNEYYVYRL